MDGRSTGCAVVWFRRDLRLADHPALAAAVGTADDVVALFVDDDALRHPAGSPRLAFLEGCLADLDAEIGGHLVRRSGDPASVVLGVAEEVGATDIYVTEDFGPYGRARDDVVAAALESRGGSLRRVGSPYAVAPGTVRNQSGAPYKVFTPFFRAWSALGAEAVTPPPSVSWVAGLRSDPPTAVPALSPSVQLPVAGESAAHARLDGYVAAGGPSAYGEQRDRPGADATTRLSPYLKFGCLHPRQVLELLPTGDPGADVLRKELAWREFYADVLFHRPASARASLVPAMTAMRVDTGPDADDRLAAWVEGRTGYPLVDAGMRQLAVEAWVHNRVRMVAASFLVKDLHLDWRRGAAVFMERLVDGDLASNQHGWQWVAGTGTDAAPYFRVFNPVAQSRRFDASGEYLRRWLPELAEVAAPAIHEPWTLPAGPPNGYPRPIVDHRVERQEALRRYAEIR